MRKYFITVIVILIFSNLNGQDKKDWFILLETGLSKVNSKNNLTFGLGAEYFINKKSSFTLRVKYFKAGIDYFKEGTSCDFGLFCSSPKRFLYEVNVLKVPLNYKWESTFIAPKLKVFFSTGVALNITLKERLLETQGFTLSKNKNNVNLNLGFGFLYKINSNLDIFTSTEIYFLGNEKTEEEVGFIFSKKLVPDERLLNIGFRFKI